MDHETISLLEQLAPDLMKKLTMRAIILERIARNPDRGLAIAPGQTVEDLFREREELYRRYATLSVPTSGIGALESARRVLEKLAAL